MEGRDFFAKMLSWFRKGLALSGLSFHNKGNFFATTQILGAICNCQGPWGTKGKQCKQEAVHG
jgi:hypothetical protein